MELGIRGRRALVCAASRGLGRACAEALAAEGVDLVITARTEGPLRQAADEIAARFGVKVEGVAADVTTEEGRTKILAVCADPDILVNNAGGPPPGDFRDWDEAMWHKALQSNMVAPIMLIRAVIDPMIARRFGRIVNITSGAVKKPLATLGLSNGARTGLTGFVAGLARQVAKHNVTINNLLPGAFDTDRLRSNLTDMAQREGKTLEQKVKERQTAIPAGRFGRPEELGAMCAYLCSAQAGFIAAQNMLLDGGDYPGTL